MPEREFLFALKLAPADPVRRLDEMLDDLAASVLEQVGYSPGTVREIVAVLHDALARELGLHQCDVQFRVEAGELQIVVSCAGGRGWRTVRPLP